ncbi:MAG: hypothetical protein IIA67_13930, partial [Planctomycetes bacterium]|nr:hypothetical protein [Planctomycetota bacterium]
THFSLPRAGQSAVAFLLVLLLAGTARAQGFSPDSPKVQKMVNAGLVYMQKKKMGKINYSNTLGYKCLVALAFVKSGNKRHKLVREAIVDCQGYCKRGPQAIADAGPNESIVYSTAIATIFLCSLEDPRAGGSLKYDTEIKTLIKSFELRQKRHGGFGYPRKEVGDTSMTQYGVLCFWEAMAIGIQPSRRSIRRVTNWLIRTQDPSGGFGYQAVDPGNFTRIKQKKVRLSLAVAGTGSLYVAGDLLGLTEGRGAQSEGLPRALRIKLKKREKPKAAVVDVDPVRLERAKRMGNAWIRDNFQIDPEGFTYYYLYTLERYHSFREKADGSRGTGWYNKGVRYLKVSQEKNGSWDGQGGPMVDTAFAVLFLLRSTKKAIDRIKPLDGQLGGRKPLAKKIIADIEQQLKILEAGPKHPDYYDVVNYGKELRGITNRAQLRSLAERFRRIMTGGSFSARLVAAEALGKVRDLDNVPTLIYGLTDPRWEVVVQSRDSLRLISRRFDGYGVPSKKPTEGVDADVAMLKSIKSWKAWYRSVRPDAEFIQ